MSFWERFRSIRVGETTQSVGAADANSANARTDAERDDQPHTVTGERGVASIHRMHSLQSRVSNVLAAGLMSVLALGFR